MLQLFCSEEIWPAENPLLQGHATLKLHTKGCPKGEPYCLKLRHMIHRCMPKQCIAHNGAACLTAIECDDGGNVYSRQRG